jgi:hypothetical protein
MMFADLAGLATAALAKRESSRPNSSTARTNPVTTASSSSISI